MAPQEPWCIAQLGDTGRGISGNILTLQGDCGKQQQKIWSETQKRIGVGEE